MRRPALLPTDLEKEGIPCLCPFLGIGIDMVKEEMVKKPDVSSQLGIEAMMDFKIGEKLLPLVAKPMSDIIPKLFDVIIQTHTGLICSDEDVFGAMITSNTTWESMICHSIAKEVKHSCHMVIIAHTYTSDKTRFSIDEAVDDDLEADKT
ncbi:hypothetical protein B0H10DRAFT_1949217 [Mycena sp. CBHHK59/15]|nr:hypothetical protein B0H10DRAFT_1949217 [Mycena sp. CBHHK59/15]